MKQFLCALLTLTLLLALTACAPKPYAPAGATTGDAALDGQVLAVLQEVCASKNSPADNVRAVYDWVANEIQYRASTADTSNGFTDEVTAQLAGEMLARRRGACDGEAALMAVLLRRMGCEAVIVEGQFLREDGSEWVDHAWVIACIDGKYCHLDPLYGRYYAEDAMESYCMATDAFLLSTHRWDAEQYPACR